MYYERLNRWIIGHPKTWCCLVLAFIQTVGFFAIWAVGNPWYVALAEAVIGTALGGLLLFVLARLKRPRRTRSRGFLRQGFGHGPQR
jgi:hypothetical protein